MKLKEILDRQSAIRSQIKAMEADELDEATSDELDQLVEELDGLERRRVPLAESAAKRAAILEAVESEETVTEEAVERPTGPTLTSRTKRNPWDSPDAIRRGHLTRTEMQNRAYDAIEMVSRAQYVDFSDDRAEQATRAAAKSKGIAQHILMTGSQEYYEAFRNFLEDPMGEHAQRAMTTGTGSLGYMLPFVLDPTIILTNTGSMNPFRRISRVEQTTSNTWNGVTSAGINAAFAGESVAASDNSPTMAQLQITPGRAQAWAFGSYESLEDSDLGTQLPSLFADAKDRLEEAAFATGAGTGAIPQGAVTAGTTGNTAAATAYAVADVYGLQGRLGPRWRNSSSCAWLANLFYINKTRQFDTAGGSSFWANLGMDTPERLLGKPIYESTSMSSGTASGQSVLLFGDFSQYVIVDRVGMRIVYEPMLTAAATANLPTGEAGWYAFWRVGAKASTANALQVLKIQ